jgi:hypothetical protein
VAGLASWGWGPGEPAPGGGLEGQVRTPDRTGRDLRGPEPVPGRLLCGEQLGVRGRDAGSQPGGPRPSAPGAGQDSVCLSTAPGLPGKALRTSVASSPEALAAENQRLREALAKRGRGFGNSNSSPTSATGAEEEMGMLILPGFSHTQAPRSPLHRAGLSWLWAG